MKIYTVAELNKLESEKNSELKKIHEEIAALESKRPKVLLAIAEGEDPAAPKELRKLESQLANLRIQSEVIGAFLQSTSTRKGYARGLEIEAKIPEIEERIAAFNGLVADINKKAPPLIEASKKLYDFLGGFYAMDEMGSIDLKQDLMGQGLGVLDKYSFFTPKGSYRDQPAKLDYVPVLLGAVYDKEMLATWIEHAKATIEKRCDAMRKKARQLKSENSQEANKEA